MTLHSTVALPGNPDMSQYNQGHEPKILSLIDT
jgi:hypothetical protein